MYTTEELYPRTPYSDRERKDLLLSLEESRRTACAVGDELRVSYITEAINLMYENKYDNNQRFE